MDRPRVFSLSHLRHARVIRAIGAMLRENLDPNTTELGLDLKVLAGIVFATIAENESLAADVRALGSHRGLSAEAMIAMRAFASHPGAPPPKAAAKAQTALLVTCAAAYSPARITASLVARCREVQLTPAEIVELVSWISVLQMLHRLTSYFQTSSTLTS